MSEVAHLVIHIDGEPADVAVNPCHTCAHHALGAIDDEVRVLNVAQMALNVEERVVGIRAGEPHGKDCRPTTTALKPVSGDLGEGGDRRTICLGGSPHRRHELSAAPSSSCAARLRMVRRLRVAAS